MHTTTWLYNDAILQCNEGITVVQCAIYKKIGKQNLIKVQWGSELVRYTNGPK